MEDSTPTATDIAFATIAQLRQALELEQQKSIEMSQDIDSLQSKRDDLENTLLDTALNLDLEAAKSEMLYACTLNDSPSSIVKSAYTWFPEDTEGELNIFCAIRVGDGWMMITGNDKGSFPNIKCEQFDKTIHQYEIGHSFTAVSIPPAFSAFFANNCLHYSEKSLVRVMVTQQYRCVWLFYANRHQDREMSFNYNNDEENIAYESSFRASTNLLPLFEIASTAIMTLMLRRLQSDEQGASVVASNILARVSQELFTNDNSAVSTDNLSNSPNGSISLHKWQNTIPSILSNEISAFCRAELFLINSNCTVMISSIRGIVTSTAASDMSNLVFPRSLISSAMQSNQQIECSNKNNPLRNNIFDMINGEKPAASITVLPLWSNSNSDRKSTLDAVENVEDWRNIAGGIVFRSKEREWTNIERLIIGKLKFLIGSVMREWISRNIVAIVRNGNGISKNLMVYTGVQEEDVDEVFDPSVITPLTVKLASVTETFTSIYASGETIRSYAVKQAVEKGKCDALLDNMASLFGGSWCCLLSFNTANSAAGLQNLALLNPSGMLRSFKLQELSGKLNSFVSSFLTQDGQEVQSKWRKTTDNIRVLNDIPVGTSGVINLISGGSIGGDRGDRRVKADSESELARYPHASVLGFLLSENNVTENYLVLVVRSFLPYNSVSAGYLWCANSLVRLYNNSLTAKFHYEKFQESLTLNSELKNIRSEAEIRLISLENVKLSIRKLVNSGVANDGKVFRKSLLDVVDRFLAEISPQGAIASKVSIRSKVMLVETTSFQDNGVTGEHVVRYELVQDGSFKKLIRSDNSPVSSPLKSRSFDSERGSWDGKTQYPKSPVHKEISPAESSQFVEEIVLFDHLYLFSKTSLILNLTLQKMSDISDEIVNEQKLFIKPIVISFAEYVREVLDYKPLLLVNIQELDTSAVKLDDGKQGILGGALSANKPGDKIQLQALSRSLETIVVNCRASEFVKSTMKQNDSVSPSSVLHRLYSPIISKYLEELSAIFGKSQFLFMPVLQYYHHSTYAQGYGVTPVSEGDNINFVPLFQHLGLESGALDLTVPSKLRIFLREYVEELDIAANNPSNISIVSNTISSIVYNLALESSMFSSRRDSSLDAPPASEFLNSNCLLYSFPLDFLSARDSLHNVSSDVVVNAFTSQLHVFVLCQNQTMVNSVSIAHVHKLLQVYMSPLKLVRILSEYSTLLSTSATFASHLNSSSLKQLPKVSSEDSLDIVDAGLQFNDCMSTVGRNLMDCVSNILQTQDLVTYAVHLQTDENGISKTWLEQVQRFSSTAGSTFHNSAFGSKMNRVLDLSSANDSILRIFSGSILNGVAVDEGVISYESLMQYAVDNYEIRPFSVVRILLYGNTADVSSQASIALFAVIPSVEMLHFPKNGKEQVLHPRKKALSPFVMEKLRVVAHTAQGILTSLDSVHRVLIRAQEINNKYIVQIICDSLNCLRANSSILDGIINTISAKLSDPEDSESAELLNVSDPCWSSLLRTLTMWLDAKNLESVNALATLDSDAVVTPRSFNVDAAKEFLRNCDRKGGVSLKLSERIAHLLADTESQVKILKNQYDSVSQLYKTTVKRYDTKDTLSTLFIKKLCALYGLNLDFFSENSPEGVKSRETEPDDDARLQKFEDFLSFALSTVEFDRHLFSRVLSIVSTVSHPEIIIKEIQDLANIFVQRIIDQYDETVDATSLLSFIPASQYAVIAMNYLLKSNKDAGIAGIKSLDMLQLVIENGKPIFFDNKGDIEHSEIDAISKSKVSLSVLEDNLNVSFVPIIAKSESNSTEVVAAVQYSVPKCIGKLSEWSAVQNSVCYHISEIFDKFSTSSGNCSRGECSVAAVIQLYEELYQYVSSNSLKDSRVKAAPASPFHSPAGRKSPVSPYKSSSVKSLVNSVQMFKCKSKEEAIQRILEDEFCQTTIAKIIALALNVNACVFAPPVPHTSRSRSPDKLPKELTGFVARHRSSLNSPTELKGEGSSVAVDEDAVSLGYDILNLVLGNPGQPVITKGVLPSKRASTGNRARAEPTAVPVDKYSIGVPLITQPTGSSLNFTQTPVKGRLTIDTSFIAEEHSGSNVGGQTVVGIIIESEHRLLAHVEGVMLQNIENLIFEPLCNLLLSRDEISNQTTEIGSLKKKVRLLEDYSHGLIDVINISSAYRNVLTSLFAISPRIENDKTIADADYKDKSVKNDCWAQLTHLIEDKLPQALDVRSVSLLRATPSMSKQALETSAVRMKTSTIRPQGENIFLIVDWITESSVVPLTPEIANLFNDIPKPQDLVNICFAYNCPVLSWQGELTHPGLPCIYFPVILRDPNDKSEISSVQYDGDYALVVNLANRESVEVFMNGDVSLKNPGDILSTSAEFSCTNLKLAVDFCVNILHWLINYSTNKDLDTRCQTVTEVRKVNEDLYYGFEYVGGFAAPPCVASNSDSSIIAQMEGGYISNISALAASLSYVFNKPTVSDARLNSKNFEGIQGVELLWFTPQSRQWNKVHNVCLNEEGKPLSSIATLNMLLSAKKWSTQAMSVVDPDDRNRLSNADISLSVPRYVHDGIMESLRDYEGSWHYSDRLNRSIWVTDVVGKPIINSENLTAGCILWVHCNVDMEAEPPQSPSKSKIKVDLNLKSNSVSDCLLRIVLGIDLPKCSIFGGILNNTFGDVLNGVQSYASTLIQSVLYHENSTKCVAQQSDLISDQNQLLKVVSECSAELSVEGGRISNVCVGIQKVLSTLHNVAGVGIICQNAKDGHMLYDAFSETAWVAKNSNIQANSPKEREQSAFDAYLSETGLNKSEVKLNVLLQDPTYPVEHFNESGKSEPTNRSLFLTDLHINGTYRPLFLQHPYAEVNFSCYDVVGKIFIFSNEIQDILGNVAQSFDILTLRRINLKALGFDKNSVMVIESIAQALGRRVYELVKGHKNKHLMMISREEIVLQRNNVIAKEETVSSLEATRAVLAQELHSLKKDNDKLRELYRDEQNAHNEAVKQHKAMAQQLRKVSADCKAEYERKERILRKQLVELDLEKSGLESKVDKDERQLLMLNEKLSTTEKARRDLEGAVLTFQQDFHIQKDQKDKLIFQLQNDHSVLSKALEEHQHREDDLLHSSERRQKSLLGTLKTLEEEHSGCKNLIFQLRRQNDADIKQLAKVRSELESKQVEANNFREQIRNLERHCEELQGKCNTYVQLNKELSKQLQDTVAKIVSAPSYPMPPTYPVNLPK